MRKKSSSHAKTTAESAYYLALTQTDTYCFQNVTGEYPINRQLTSKHDSKKSTRRLRLIHLKVSESTIWVDK